MPRAATSVTPDRRAPGSGCGDAAAGSAALTDQKFARWRRTGLFGNDTKGATIRRACSAEELAQAYRLVHEVYIGTGYLKLEPAAPRLRIFETSSETATFIAQKDGVIVGVLSVVPNTWDLGLPADGAFGTELDAMRATGRKLCELTNQAVAADFRRSAVPTELMRCAMAHALAAGYHDTIATVSPSHHGFYETVGFSRIGSERSYSEKLHDPVIALSLDLDRFRAPPTGPGETERFLHHFAADGNPYRAKVGWWEQQARRCFLTLGLLQRLFVDERNFVAECSDADRQILQRRWGQEIFGAVTGLGCPAGTAGQDPARPPEREETLPGLCLA